MIINPKLILVLVMMTTFVACAQDNEEFVWPNGAKAAICLTYDDGLSSHVNTVGPILKKYNFKASFYPTLNSSSLSEETEKWRSLVSEGNELGNHMAYHPCQKSLEPWVESFYDLDTYTKMQLENEIELSNNFLSALGVDKSRTFAYPCAHEIAGGESYKPYISENFSAARSSSEEQVELVKPSLVDLYSVISWAPNKSTSKDLIEYIDKIIEKETLSTLTFHGIGAEHMRVSKKDHEELLEYLNSNRDKIWVATFKEATDYLIKMRTKMTKSK